MAVVPANGDVLPAGAALDVRLNQRLSTEGSSVGDRFNATVTTDLRAQNGELVVPAGALVHGRVVALDDSDDPTDRALIQLAFDSLTFGGRRYTFGANITGVEAVEQRSRSTGKVVQRAAAGAAAGAVIGAIIRGPDLENIIRGGVIGAAAGTVLSLGLGDVEHVIPAGTRMTIQATQTVALR